MAESTIETLGHMVFSNLLKGPVKKIYQKLSGCMRFKSMCIDKTASISAKIEGIVKRHNDIEQSVDELQNKKVEAEEIYNSLQRQSPNMKSLQQTIESDSELHMALRKLVEAGIADSLSQKNNLTVLLNQDKELTEKMSTLQQQQVELISTYIKDFRQSHRELYQALLKLGRKIALKNEEAIYAYQDICAVGAETVVLDISEKFRESCRETPMGYRHMELDEFIDLGVKAIQQFYQLQMRTYELVQKYITEPLTALFQELVEFHSTFFSTQREISQVFEQESQQFQILSKKVAELSKMIGEYVSRLAILTKPAEIAAYEREEQAGPRPSEGPDKRPPPNLRPY